MHSIAIDAIISLNVKHCCDVIFKAKVCLDVYHCLSNHENLSECLIKMH